MASIIGEGYGSSHKWEWRLTLIRSTVYRCAECLVEFTHNHSSTPDIFRSIESYGVDDECPGVRIPA